MSRIIGPNRHTRGMKQSILFSQGPQPQQTPTYSYSSQDDFVNSINSAISGISNQQTREPTQHSTKPKRVHSRASVPEQVQPDYNSGTMHAPENFSTVSIDASEIANIQAINNNASHRVMSSTMYEDTSSHDSNYKRTVINNMARDVLSTAAYLCQSSESESRSYENQVNSPFDSSYGAHQLNLIAAQRIINRNKH